MTPKRLRLVVFQEEPGLWLVRGLEHDLGAEARTIGEAIRAAMQFVQAHTAFDVRHDHLPLAAFPPAAQKYWNAFATGTPVSLSPADPLSRAVRSRRASGDPDRPSRRGGTRAAAGRATAGAPAVPICSPVRRRRPGAPPRTADRTRAR